MKQKHYYKIVEVDNDGYPRTLFHGVNGKKKLPINRWIQADIKPIQTPSGTIYLSGFHFTKTLQDIMRCFSLFKNKKKRYIIKCYAKNFWRKEQSRYNVFLSEFLYIPWPQKLIILDP